MISNKMIKFSSWSEKCYERRIDQQLQLLGGMLKFCTYVIHRVIKISLDAEIAKLNKPWP